MRVKKGRRGPIKSPLPRQKALDAVRPRVPVTLWLSKKPTKAQKRRGPTLRARGAPLALTRARGGRDHPLPTSARSPTRAEKVCSRKTKQKGKKNNKAREAHENPCRLASKKKGLRTSTRRIPKTHGAQNGTPKNRQEAGRTAKTGKEQTRRDTKREKEQAKQVRVRGCPVTT